MINMSLVSERIPIVSKVSDLTTEFYYSKLAPKLCQLHHWSDWRVCRSANHCQTKNKMVVGARDG